MDFHRDEAKSKNGFRGAASVSGNTTPRETNFRYSYFAFLIVSKQILPFSLRSF